MGTVQTAELLLRLRDDLSQPAAKASSSLDKMRAAEQKLADQCGALAEASKKLAGFQSLDAKLQKTTDRFAAQAKTVELLNTKIAESAKPTKALLDSYEKAQRRMEATNDAMQKQRDRLEALSSAFNHLGVGPLDNFAAAEARIREQVDATTEALRTQGEVSRQTTERHEKSARRLSALKSSMGLVGMIAGPTVLHATGEAVKSGAELQHERIEALKKGMTPREIKQVEDQSFDLATLTKNLTPVQVMELAGEARSVLSDPKDLAKVLPALAKARSVLDARDPSGSSSEGLASLVKGAESLGAGQNPDRLVRLINAYVKGMQVMGKTINPEQIYDFDKNARTAGAQLSDRFLMTTGLSLSQELSGSSAGKAVNQLTKQMIGGLAHQTVPTLEMMNLGLIDRKNVRFNKMGEVSGVKKGVLHAVHGDQLLAHDPDLWTYDYLLPALESHGITKVDDQLAMVRKILPGTQAADLVSKLITQRASFENHAKLYDKASGYEGYKLNARDPIAALSELEKSLQTFSTTLTSPIMPEAAKALDTLSTWLGKLSLALKSFDEAHPLAGKALGAAAVAGSLTVGTKMTFGAFEKLFGESGMKESSAALSGSAKILDSAGGKLLEAAGRLAGKPGGVPEPGAATEPGVGGARTTRGKPARFFGSPGKGLLLGGPMAVLEAYLYQLGTQAIDTATDAFAPKYPPGYDPTKIRDRSLVDNFKAVADDVAGWKGGSLSKMKLSRTPVASPVTAIDWSALWKAVTNAIVSPAQGAEAFRQNPFGDLTGVKFGADGGGKGVGAASSATARLQASLGSFSKLADANDRLAEIANKLASAENNLIAATEVLADKFASLGGLGGVVTAAGVAV